jgi:hypothetical protein
MDSRSAMDRPPALDRPSGMESRLAPPSGHSEQARVPVEWAGTPPGEPARPRRRRSAGVILGVLAVLAVASLVAAILLDQARREQEPPGTSVSTPPSSSRSPEAEPSPKPSTPPKPAEAASPSKAIAEYYDLMPDDPDEGFSRLTSGYQGTAGGYASYRNFWSGFSDVRASDITSNGAYVEASLVYVRKNGDESRERRSFTMAEEDGRWLIAESEVISSS